MSPLEYYEKWLPVKGYEGFYEVSNFGRVRSLSRKAFDGRYLVGKIMALRPTREGYLIVGLRNDGQKNFTVHSLVAEAFLGPCPINKECHHRDEDKTNNCLHNLRYITRAKHALLHPKTKLTNEQILEIKHLFKEGFRQVYLADKFNISKTHVYNIVRNNRRKVK